MTNEELAKHWGISLREVKRISDIVNTHYHSAIGQHKKTKLFHPVLFKMHESPSGAINFHMVASCNKGFQTEEEAERFWNELLDKMTIPEVQNVWNIPADSFKVLKKLEIPTTVSHKIRATRIVLERDSKE